MKAIVLLHGAIGASDQLTDLRLLLEKNYKVYTFDFTGHGKRSNENTDFSIENFAADLDSFLQKQQLKHPFIFGYSMGGYVAIYHALHYANKAKKISTLGTKFSWSPEKADNEIKMLDAERIEKKIPQFAQQLKLRHGAKEWNNVLEKTASMMIKMGNKNSIFPMQLKKLETPVHFGLGEEDKMVTKDETELFCKGCKNGSMYILPNTQHPIEKTNISELENIIHQFFGQ